MRAVLLLLLLLPSLSWATITNAAFQRTVLTCGDGSATRNSKFPSGVCNPPNVYWTTDFETGALLDNAVVGGFGLQALERNQAQTTCEFTTVSDGGAGPDADLEARVVGSGAAVGADTVDARVGAYFFKFSLDKTKQYHWINGDSTCTDASLNKPRVKLYNNALSRIRYDTETWVGFSLYIPSDFEHDTGFTGTDERLSNMIVVANAEASRTQFILGHWVLDGATTDWVLQIFSSSTQSRETNITNKSLTIAGCDPDTAPGCRYMLKIGDMVSDADIGVWTDFVIRFRLNPYASGVTCNPATGSGAGCTTDTYAQGQSASYTGGNGIMQVWKSVGAGRTMTLRIDLTAAQVGLVPLAPTTYYPVIEPRAYKYGWIKNTQTTAVGPLEYGLDEWRWGEAAAAPTGHGTGYADVHPTAEAQP